MSFLSDLQDIFNSIQESSHSFQHNLLSSSITQHLQSIVSKYHKHIDVDTDHDELQEYLDVISSIEPYISIPDTLFHELTDTYIFHPESIPNIQYNIQLYCRQSELLLQAVNILYKHIAILVHQHSTTVDTYITSTILLCIQYTINIHQFKCSYDVMHDETSNRNPYDYVCEWITATNQQHANELLHTISKLYNTVQPHTYSMTDTIGALLDRYMEPCVKLLLTQIKQYDQQQRRLDKFHSHTHKHYWYTHSTYKLLLLQLCSYSTKQSIQSILHIFIPLTVTLIDEAALLNRCIGCMCLQSIVYKTTGIQLQWYNELLCNTLINCLTCRDIEYTELLLPLYVQCMIKLHPHIPIKQYHTQLNSISATPDQQQIIRTQYRSMLHHKQKLFQPILSELNYLSLSPSKNDYISLIVYLQQLQHLIPYMSYSLIQYYERIIPILFSCTLSLNSTIRKYALQCIVLVLQHNTQRMLYHTNKLFEQCCTVYLHAQHEIQLCNDQLNDPNPSDNQYVRQYLQKQDDATHEWNNTKYHVIQLMKLLQAIMNNHMNTMEPRNTWQQLMDSIANIEQLNSMYTQLQ